MGLGCHLASVYTYPPDCRSIFSRLQETEPLLERRLLLVELVELGRHKMHFSPVLQGH